MRKAILGLPLAGVLAFITLLFLAGREAEARWVFRDHTTAVNPVSVCKDGVYLGVGDKTVSGPIEVTAVLEDGGQEVFSRVYDDLPPNTDENVDLAYSDYFLESWDEEDRPLTPGDVVIFPGGMMRNPTATVENCTVLQTAPAASGFSYQGTLRDGEQPANGPYDLRFRLWDAANGGSQQGAALTLDNVPVSDGVFNVRLDFGPTAFSAGRARWLEMGVRPAGSDESYTTLSPRQELLAAPYAHSLIAGAAIYGHSAQEPALTVENRLGAALQVGGGFQGLVVDYADREGVRVDSAGYDAFSVGKATYGLRVEEVMTNGVDIRVAGVSGLRIGSAGADGVLVDDAGDDGLQIGSASGSGVVVGSTGFDGALVEDAGDDGVQIQSSSDDGIYVFSAGGDGIQVSSASNYGVNIGSAGADGVRVGNAGDDGVNISSATDDGVAVDSANDDGLHILSTNSSGIIIDKVTNSGVVVYDAGIYGVWADTSAVDGYGFYTPDRIYGSNLTSSSLSLVAQVTGTETLQSGDVVSAAGVATLDESGGQLLPQVVRAEATGGAGVIGVVESRLALVREGPDRVDSEGAAVAGEGPATWQLQPQAGPAQAGDYVSLIIYGVTYVRIEAGAALEPGMRLTPADTSGAVRPLRTETIEGMTVTEDTPVVGVLLEAPDAESGLAPVFVTLR